MDEKKNYSRTWDARMIRTTNKKEKYVLTHPPKTNRSPEQGDETKGFFVSKEMFLGIKLSALRQKDSEPVESDFKKTTKIFFDVNNKETLSWKEKNVEFKDYSPLIFHKIRQYLGIQTKKYVSSISNTGPLFELGQLGKSGSDIYYTQDIFLTLKKIKKKEFLFLKKILKKYHHHVKNNQNTFLVGILGLHRMDFQNGEMFYILVMKNIFYSDKECSPCSQIKQIYDLKGSTFQREQKEDIKIKKDLDWIKDKKKLEKNKEALKQIAKDADFLERIGAMDYSLLVGFTSCNKKTCLLENITNKRFKSSNNEEIACIGIIDILTEYTTKKKIESFFKSIIFSKNKISAINPALYRKRFVLFLRDYLFKTD